MTSLHSKKQIDQKSVTVHFKEPFDAEFQLELRTRLLGSNRRRIEERRQWESAKPIQHAKSQVPGSTPEVPTDPTRAEELLIRLRERGADQIVSDLFEEFRAAVRPEAMMHAYLSEIDVGVTGGIPRAGRILEGISILNSAVIQKKISPSSGHYAIGNAHLALKNFEGAITSYDAALETEGPGEALIIAQVLANRGSAYKGLGEIIKCMESYEQALKADPSLAEARMMLAHHCVESRDYCQALEHLNHTIRRRGSAVMPESMHGWRALVHFRLGNHQLAFQDIWSIVAHAENLPWAWSWSANLVANHGAYDIESTQMALMFWDEFQRGHPEHLGGRLEALHCEYMLKNLESARINFEQFRENSLELAELVPNEKPLLLDRIGHWAQVDSNWNEAETAFRSAFELRPETFACCLGTALNFLERYEEAIEVMLPFADTHPEDAIVQFQLGVSLSRTARNFEAAKRFARAAMLDMSYEKAWFNLGGNLWNISNASVELDDWAYHALRIWAYALTQWPDHELSYELKSNLPILGTFAQTQGENDPNSILDNVMMFLAERA